MIDLKKYIAETPNFPSEGVLFRDISPLLEDNKAFEQALVRLLQATGECDGYVGLDSRGFIFASPMAMLTNKSLILARKAGKLPGPVETVSYDLEYGSASIEMHPTDTHKKVWIIDDLIATGGSALAAIELATKCGYEVVGVAALIELKDLGGRKLIEDLGYEVRSIVVY